MSEDLLDVNEFMERVQDDKELLLELLDIFLADYMEKRKTLQDAVDGQDFEQIKGVAHSLKGASGNISAKSMREIFSSLEEMGKNSDVSGAGEALTNLDQIFEALQGRIDKLKEELKD